MADQVEEFIKSLDRRGRGRLEEAVGRELARRAGDQAPGPPGAKAPNPSAIFSIPQDVRHLEPEQAGAFTQAFRAWREQAGSPARRLARGRMWLVFLLLRFTGARLGEVLALDPARDLDLAQGLVRLGPAGRAVRIPDDLTQELAGFLADPALAGLAEPVFALDQGYVRRKFRERAKECGLAAELASPRVLRNTRGIELLRQGLPLTIVQGILGQGTASLTANYLTFAEEDIERIVRFYIQKELNQRTSARNSFRGRVTGLRQDGLSCLVELVTSGGFGLAAVITRQSLANLGLRLGSPVTALVKAPWVIIAKGPEEPVMGARNQLAGVVAQVETDQVSGEVAVALADGTQVCALITAQSARELDLKPGDPVWAVFKTSTVILTVD